MRLRFARVGSGRRHAHRRGSMRKPRLRMAVAAVAAVAGAAAIAWMRRELVLVTVNGLSVAPTYRDGDRLLVRRRRLDEVRRGDVVVIEPPDAVPAGAPVRPGRRLRPSWAKSRHTSVKWCW
jgi:signal peptidase I